MLFYTATKENKIDINYLLGIINSKLLNWYYQTLNPEKGEALAEVKKSNVARLPIKEISSKNRKEHDEIVKHVDQLLKLNRELIGERLQSKNDEIKQRIEHSEEKINRAVYDLYDLKKEEIEIIEGKTDE